VAGTRLLRGSEKRKEEKKVVLGSLRLHARYRGRTTLKHVGPRSVHQIVDTSTGIRQTDGNPTTGAALRGKPSVAANAGSDPKG